MLIYIAGKITGDPMYKHKFADAEMALQHEGHIVLNPCVLPAGMEYEQYMRIDAAKIAECDAVCLLEDWESSSGARREYEMATGLGKEIILYENVRCE